MTAATVTEIHFHHKGQVLLHVLMKTSDGKRQIYSSFSHYLDTAGNAQMNLTKGQLSGNEASNKCNIDSCFEHREEKYSIFTAIDIYQLDIVAKNFGFSLKCVVKENDSLNDSFLTLKKNFSLQIVIFCDYVMATCSVS